MTIQYIVTIGFLLSDESIQPKLQTLKRKYSAYNFMGVSFATEERETAENIIKDINSMDKLTAEAFYAILPDKIDEFSVYVDFFGSTAKKKETDITVSILKKHGGIMREYFTFNRYATEEIVKIFNRHLSINIWTPIINKKGEKIYRMLEIPVSPEAFIVPRATEISEDAEPYNTYTVDSDSNPLISKALEKYVNENHIAEISKTRTGGKEYKTMPRLVFSSKLIADLFAAKVLSKESLYLLPTVDIVVSKNLLLG